MYGPANNKITVCHLSFNHAAFDDRIYWKELLALKENGYEAIHICVGNTDRTFTSKEGIKIIEVKKKQFLRNVWLNRIAQLLLYKRNTIHIIFEKARLTNAAIYHYHDLQLNAIAKKLKKLPQRPKVIYDAHEAYHLLFKENAPHNLLLRPPYNIFIALAKKWELSHAKQCHYIIATDEYTLNYFQKKLPAIAQHIVYNYSYFLPEENELSSVKKYDFIYTGLLSKGRGIKEIIVAASLLVKEFNAIKVLLIGSFDTPQFEYEINNLIKELHIADHIVLHEAVSFIKIKFYYEQSGIGLGIFHPTPKYTTFVPIKLFEYMAFGLPVIFSNHGPSAAIIQQTNCGLLVDTTDATAIYEAMKKLLSDKNLYETCSLRAIAAVKQYYNWNKEKEKLLHIYATLLDNKL